MLINHEEHCTIGNSDTCNCSAQHSINGFTQQQMDARGIGPAIPQDAGGLDLEAAIKNILSTVRDAANGYHNSQQWSDAEYGLPSYWEQIEQAEEIAIKVARLRAAPAPVDLREPAIQGDGFGRTHILKVHPAPFSALLAGKKNFEWRKFDRDYRIGDTLILNEFDPEKGELTGICIQRRVTYLISNSFGIPADYCIMALAAPVEPRAEPVSMVLHCPECRTRHIDVGEFATKPHHTHACQGCGFVWRPAIGPTLGVQFLPGFKNETVRTPTKINLNEEGQRCATCDGTYRHAHAYDDKGEIPSRFDEWLPENLMTPKEIQP